MVEPLVEDGFDGVVVLGFNGGFECGRLLNEILDVALEAATEGHDVHLLAIGPDDADFLTHESIDPFPCRNHARRLFPSRRIRLTFCRYTVAAIALGVGVGCNGRLLFARNFNGTE